MTIRDMVRAAADHPALGLQFLNDCVVAARTVKRTKKQPAHHVITFETDDGMTPNDLLWLSLSETDRQTAQTRKPKFVGVILWIPTETYEAWAGEKERGQ